MDKKLIVAIALLAVVSSVIVWWTERDKFSATDWYSTKTGLSKRVLAMELVTAREDVQAIVGEKGDPNRETMRARVRKDFFFIACYWLLFGALGWLIGRGSYSWAIWVGAAIALCATGAAAFDIIENLGIFHVLDAQLSDTTAEMLNRVRSAALAKWALTFITMALLSPIVFVRRDLFVAVMGASGLVAFLGVITGLAYVLAAVIGLIGLKYNFLIEKASIFMLAALLLTVSLLLISVLGTYLRHNANQFDKSGKAGTDASST